MKKITALLVALALFATTAFAAPISVVASLPESAQTMVSSTDLDDLFADVSAVALTDIEAQTVEGDGPIAAVAGAIVGAVVGVAAVVTNVIPYNPPSQSRDNTASKVVTAATVIASYAGMGAVIGAGLPTP
jgi:hypothetical protein